MEFADSTDPEFRRGTGDSRFFERMDFGARSFEVFCRGDKVLPESVIFAVDLDSGILPADLSCIFKSAGRSEISETERRLDGFSVRFR